MNAMAWLGGLVGPLAVPWGQGTLEVVLPWVPLLAPLPLMLTLWQAPWTSRVDALHVPFFDAITQATGRTTHDGAVLLRRSWFERAVGLLAWLALLLAVAQPVWVDPPQQRIVPARDLLLVLDISQSMETRDFPDSDNALRDRLGGARRAIDDFVRLRSGDRIGLIVFANAAHVAVPFTLDHAVLHETLGQMAAGMAGPRTMVGDAIGLGIKLFDASAAPAKVMVLLTDGADTGSRIPPETAARLAHDHGIVIHTVALGQPGNATDKVDVAALRAIATVTNGRFALAGRQAELVSVYADIDAREPQNHTQLTHRARHALFQWPLGVVAALFFGGQLLVALAALWRERVLDRMPAEARAEGQAEVPDA